MSCLISFMKGFRYYQYTQVGMIINITYFAKISKIWLITS